MVVDPGTTPDVAGRPVANLARRKKRFEGIPNEGKQGFRAKKKKTEFGLPLGEGVLGQGTNYHLKPNNYFAPCRDYS